MKKRIATLIYKIHFLLEHKKWPIGRIWYVDLLVMEPQEEWGCKMDLSGAPAIGVFSGHDIEEECYLEGAIVSRVKMGGEVIWWID